MTRTTRTIRTRDRRTTRQKAWLTTCSAAYQRHSLTLLRASVGLLYLWFGALKFIPDMSPAQDIATHAMSVMTLGTVPAAVSGPLLALMEVLIGIGLLTGRLPRLTMGVFFAHMAGVFTTLLLMPSDVWLHAPLVPTMEGQYILKNIVLVTACLTIATRRPASPGTIPAEQAPRRGMVLRPRMAEVAPSGITAPAPHVCICS
ncbi:DoxX family protein [Streptomyces sp. NPDC029674]|uniref:DoxX family protein n=1 Tax=Streptomyces sp. NPDC029674 TaxID=3365297 RepID=UPI00384D0E2A